MGEIAEMMLDGTLCEQCGVYMGDATDFPRLCPSCAKAARKAGRQIENLGSLGYCDAGPVAPLKNKKVSCPECGKRVKPAGVYDHMRDVHEADTQENTK